MNCLNEHVLVLNRQWQVIGTISTQVAFCDLCRGVATGIDCETMQAVRWSDWLKLSVRDGDKFVDTIHGPVRAPSVVCKSSYSKMPIKRPKLTRQAIAERDGYRCQYTGKHVPRGTVDHIQPTSRGGAKKSWRNVVWCDPQINSKKGNKLNEEAGLKLIKQPIEPKPQPVCALIKSRPDKPEWDMFLKA